MKRRLLTALFALSLCLLVGLPATTAPAAPQGSGDGLTKNPMTEPATIYVSESGNDSTGNGSAEDPYATLAKAVGEAEDGAVIKVMTNLEVNSLARVTDKHLTITSADAENPATLTRGKVQGSDNNQSHYNSAMIEVTTNGEKDSEDASSVTLANIVLTDNGKHDGTYFAQTNTKTISNSNLDFVQDGMVTAHGKSNRAVHIILGDGAVLEDYGGMSAVYGTMNAHITMNPGSSITAPDVTDRLKSNNPPNDETGAAGAVWLQGAEFVMESGAQIHDMIGRAVYCDGGNATISGTISNIVGDDDMWWSNDGIAAHGRASAVVDFTASSLVSGIYDEDKQGNSDRVIYSTGAKLTVSGTVQDCHAMNIIYASGGKDDKACTIDGTIQKNMSDGDNGYSIVAEGTDLIFGETAQIRENKAGIATVYAAAGAKIDLYGHIDENTGGQCGGIFMYGNYSGGRSITVDMYGDATLTGNKRDTKPFDLSFSNMLKDRGGAVCSGGSTHGQTTVFTVHGGTISENTSNYGALYVRKNGHAVITGTAQIRDNTGYGVYIESDSGMKASSLTMDGGSIEDNTKAGINYRSGYENFVTITGGKIAGNGTDCQISVSGGSARDASERLSIASGVLQGNTAVSVSAGTVTLDTNYTGVALGQASTAVRDALKTSVAAQHSDWTVAGSSALWIKPEETAEPYHFTITRPTAVKKTGLFAAYIPLKADGTLMEGAQAVLTEVNNEAVIDVTLPALPEGASAYGLMFANNKEYTLRPDDISIYTGGGHNNEEYDNGFPELTLYNCVDLNTNKELSSLEINGQAITEGNLMEQLVNLFTVTYQDANGTPIVNDETAGEYTAVLSWKDGTPKTLRINGNDVVGIETGTLIIRYTEDQEEAEDGTNTYPLLEKETPDTPVTHAEAFAKKEYGILAPKFHINGDTNRQITNTAGISILDDSLLLEDENDNRQQLLEDRAAEVLTPLDNTKTYVFDFHYLDLVDAFNGNAWVTASGGTTVYLPYPAGTDENTQFTLVHYKDLHREYGISGQARVEEAIKACELEAISTDNTPNGIKFDVATSGFSPFALVWEVDACTITASAGEGGTITPNGDVKVAKGSDQTFTIEASEGYQISDVKVDGVSVGAVDEYTFNSVTNDHSISATFTKKSNPPTTYYHIDASAGSHGSISPSGRVSVASGSSKTFTFTPDEGYEVATVTVDGTPVDSVSSYTFTNVTADHKIAVTFQDKSDIANPDDTGVSDVLDTKHHIAYLHGYANGTGAFGTIDPMTRAEAAAMFYNLLLEQDVTIAKSFADVPSDAWYHDAVCTMATLGYIKGVGDGTCFEPNRSITRAEFTAIAMRFAHMPEGGSNPFTDVPEDAWYRNVVVGAVTYGWINGYDDHTFGPNDTLQRAQAAAITNHLLGRVPDEHFIDAWASHLKSFADIAAGHWAYLEVMEATNGHEYTGLGSDETWIRLAADQHIATPEETGIDAVLNAYDHIAFMHGVGDGSTFMPDSAMTRAEAATMFYNLLLEQDVAITASFEDVPEDAWYHDAVCTMATLGYIKGTGDGTHFEPNRCITRAEFATLVTRFASAKAPSTGSAFEDVPADAWYASAVRAASAWGWIGGYNTTTFGPNDNLTRAQAAAIANRMLGRKADWTFIGENASQIKGFADVDDSHWAYFEIVEATNAHEHEVDNNTEVWTKLR